MRNSGGMRFLNIYIGINLKGGIRVELKLNVKKVLILDMPFRPDMLEDGKAVVGEIEGKSVLMMNVDLNDITEQVKSQSNV